MEEYIRGVVEEYIAHHRRVLNRFLYITVCILILTEKSEF